ncbi:YcfL family protein [Motilimonas eburnea]|uniref:YcfL family protein n=1 Tax=Motilimonas eburnea TaxID=1737488 RepID=UPI001E41348A|nr:YcfL family protein [Motilimonas eburnea]MCE2572486.1 YcfL family protein [Motilimonas eburnea]
MMVLKWTLVMVLLAGLAACAQMPTTGIGIDNINLEPKVRIDNRELADKLELGNVKTKRTNDLLTVQARVANLYPYEQTLQYKFYWFDQFGFEVEHQGQPWLPLTLHGGQVAHIQGVAPNSAAQNVHVYIREVLKK